VFLLVGGTVHVVTLSVVRGVSWLVGYGTFNVIHRCNVLVVGGVV
jgi:hypothetical protein